MQTMKSAATDRSTGRGRRTMLIGGSVPVGLMIGALCSCAAPPPREQKQLVSTGKPALHAVSSQSVRQIMQKIRYHTPVEHLDKAEARERHVGDIRSLAKDMAASAATLPETANDLNLDPQEKEVFLKLAKKLSDEAAVLSHASHADFGAIERQIDTVYSTCNGCHALFRSGT